MNIGGLIHSISIKMYSVAISVSDISRRIVTPLALFIYLALPLGVKILSQLSLIRKKCLLLLIYILPIQEYTLFNCSTNWIY